MFRNNPLGSVLVSVFFVLALLTCWLSVRYFFSTRELFSLQLRHQSMQGTLNAVQALANESLAYSQRNPAIDPVLYEFGIKRKPAAATGASGAATPSTPGR